MTQQGQYEYKLEIGSLSSEVDQIFLKSWKVNEGRDIDRFATAELRLVRTTDAMAIAQGDQVRYWRRVVGEATWGPTFFLGYVVKKSNKAKDNDLTLDAKGYLYKVKNRTISSAEWGNTHIVDEELNVYTDAQGIYAYLDGDLPPQIPLERVRFLQMRELVTGGQVENFIDVENTGAGIYSKVAQMFFASLSLLRKIWVKGYRRVGCTSNLKIEIQTDGGCQPSGTVVTSFNIPYTDFGSGAGAESWVEIDLLRHVSDPKDLELAAVGWYWLVFSIVTPGLLEKFHLRYAFVPKPIERYLEDDISGNWAVRRHSTLVFGIELETDWVDAEQGQGKDYEIDPSSTSVLIIQKTGDMGPKPVPPGAGPTPGIGHFDGRVKPTLLFTGQKAIRATYWKGAITYATVLQKWAQTIASDIYDVLDISITEPTTKQFCIKVENADGLAVFRILRQFGAFYCRIYMDATNQIVLEVRDEKLPTTTVWNLYSAGEKTARTFSHGDDAGSQAEVRIADLEISEDLESENGVMSVKDERGSMQAIVGSGPVIDSKQFKLGGFGADISKANDFSQPFVTGYTGPGTSYMIRKTGRVTLSGINETMAAGPYRTSNELVKLDATKYGIADQLLAIESLKWSGGNKATTRLELALTDTIFQQYVPAFHKGGSGSIHSLAMPAFAGVSELLRASDGRFVTDLHAAGVTDTPEALAPRLGISGRAVEPVFHQDPSFPYDDTKYWWIGIGTGVPAAGDLGARKAEVLAHAKTVGPWTYLTAKFNPADLDLASTWPKEISEVGIRRSTDEMKTGIISMGAYSLGVPDGSYDIFNPRPLMGPEKRVFVTIKVVAPPP